MAKRLIKVAKELNVGKDTLVEYLNNNGFDIENKPTSKVTDEMYNSLLKEFSESIAIKEKADQLVIGTRVSPSRKEKEEVAPPSIMKNPNPEPIAEPVVETPPPAPSVPEKEEEVVKKEEAPRI